ncbi:MAG TPA: sialate O-acetylesterase [Prolixibacteraceae bacterium]|nr:sialate O-acetylesterase [Prolixibacteraceae bacterium]
MKKLFFTLLILFAFSATMFGKIMLPSIFADNMVLQQNSEVAIWGWSDPGETVKIVVSWNSKDTVKVKAGNTSAWKTTIKTITAGGPYSIRILGNSKVELKNVMLGEVWICSGQSNMEWSVNHKIMNGEEEAARATNTNIRIFHVQKIGAELPQQDCYATWSVCSPETMRSTSAIGYFFAREIQQKLNVPVGIIVSAWGGTPAEVWIEKSRIENNPVLNRHKYNERFDWWPGISGALYNSMIAPIVPYGIAGAIWYQGESNCGNYQIYSQLMKTLIENWRADFKKEFPFYLVQIAPYDYGDKGTSEYLREQQELITRTIPNTGMVVVSDLVDNIKDIHPKNKIDVGKRLANFALAETYKQNMGTYKSPSFQSMQVEKEKLRISFSNATTGLKSTGKTPVKFLISGEDQKFVPATAKIEGSTVILSSKLVKTPVAVRFCFDDTSMPDVFSTEGLPLAPFRTDKW